MLKIGHHKVTIHHAGFRSRTSNCIKERGFLPQGLGRGCVLRSPREPFALATGNVGEG